MKPKAILGQARAFLSKSQSWSQGAFAYDRTDHRVAYDAKTACSWCLEGAVRRAAKRGNAAETNLSQALALVREVIHVPGHYPTIQGWNDRATTTHREVLSVLDRAIAAA